MYCFASGSIRPRQPKDPCLLPLEVGEEDCLVVSDPIAEVQNRSSEIGDLSSTSVSVAKGLEESGSPELLVSPIEERLPEAEGEGCDHTISSRPLPLTLEARDRFVDLL